MHPIVKSSVFLLAAIVVVAALWFFFKPRSEPPTLQGPKAAGSDAPLAMNVPAEARGQAERGASTGTTEAFELTIKGGRLISGPALMQVHQGEQVTLTIKSDASDELHLHGYDLHARISPGENASLRFTADRTGRFGLELHKAHAELGALEVYPR